AIRVKTRMRRTWSTRTAYLGVLSMLTVGLLYPLGAARAYAQLVQLPRIAVLDFENKSGYGGASIARAATDAVAGEYQKSGKFEVLARGEVEQQLKDLDLAPPLERTGFLRLGRALQATSIITGEVNAVNFVGSPKQAQVVITVRVIDIASGEPINGAVATGFSNRRPGYAGDDDTLVQEAIRNAAFEAIRIINNYTIPEATVLTTRAGKEVLLNRGIRGGLQPGMEMIVIRRGEEVGRIRVTQVSDSDAVAEIIDFGRGIQSEDRARAIFRPPTVKVKAGKVTTERPRQRGEGNRLLRALGPILIIGLIAFGVARASSGGNTPVERVYAEAGVDGNFDPIVRVRWNTTLFAKSVPDMVQWQIYRSDFLGVDGNGQLRPVGVTPGNQNFFIDTTVPRNVTYVSNPRLREGIEDLDTVNLEGDSAPPGVAAGRSYTYQIALVYREQIAQDGEVAFRFKISDRVRSGQATVLFPVQLLSPLQRSEDVDPKDVRFSWVATEGANAYRVEVSTDPTFNDRNRTFVSAEILSTARGGTPVSTERIDLEVALLNRLGLTGRRVTLYWRVGARNLGDDPGPIPGPGGLRYVWSRPFEFTTQELPPSP
ncbi:MAG: CsgG/HfaB family protein, partial [Fimbriimonadales bacterium]|nr:CsgG/HfaB family protein [Fimbriimonadales bacterium]